jgi:hypothetical protein
MTPSRDRIVPADRGHELLVHVYSAQSLLEFRVFERVWAAILDPLVAADRFGRVQPYAHRITPDARQAFELFRKDRNILVGDRTKQLQARFKRRPDGVSDWWISVRLSAWDPRWVEWLVALCEAQPVLFGRVCPRDEYTRKHEIVTSVPGGRRRGVVGDTIPEFQRFLPGVYWLTLFGPELTASFDFDPVRAIDGVTVRELAGTQTAVFADAAPFVGPVELERRLRVEKEIAAALGDDYFFDRDRPDRLLRPVPALKATLDGLGGRS